MNELILDRKLDCLFLTETWLGTDAPVVLSEASPPNFSSAFSIRQGKRGGGTASICTNTLPFKSVLFEHYTSFEYHAIVFSNPRILSVTIYRPPKNGSLFIKEFSEFLSILHSSYNMIILTGDFNLHIDNRLDPISSEFLKVLNYMNFVQNVTQSTHNRGHTLDLVITLWPVHWCVLCCEPLLRVFLISLVLFNGRPP